MMGDVGGEAGLTLPQKEHQDKRYHFVRSVPAGFYPFEIAIWDGGYWAFFGGQRITPREMARNGWEYLGPAEWREHEPRHPISTVRALEENLKALEKELALQKGLANLTIRGNETNAQLYLRVDELDRQCDRLAAELNAARGRIEKLNIRLAHKPRIFVRTIPGGLEVSTEE